MLVFRSTVAVGVCLGVLVAGCGGGTTAGGGAPQDGGTTLDTGVGGDGDASSGTDASVGDAAATDGGGGDSATDAALGPHAAMPQVVNAGGTILTAPKVQFIVYTEDTMSTAADDAVTELTQTSTWSDQTSEYGVGPLTKLPTIQIAGALPGTLNDNGNGVTPFQQTLINNTTGASPAWGAADSSTIYAFLIPATTTFDGGGNCCSDFYGYHNEVKATASVSIAYAIVCECTSPAGDPLTPLENTTTTISHELVEGATDPFPYSSTAYSEPDDNDAIWGDATGGEVADMCQYNSDSNYLPPGSTYMVQRSWSNAAAAAGTNPCVPVPMPTPYFDALPVLTDTVSIYDENGNHVSSKGVTIPVGSMQTIDIQLFSTAPTSGPWTVTAYDLNDYLGNTANTTVSLDKTTGSNGDVLHLTIKVISADRGIGGEGFVLVSDLGTQENISFGAVGN
jgi:hypothetical protein